MQELEHSTTKQQLYQSSAALTFIHSPFCGTCHLARKMLAAIEATYKRELFFEFNASLHPDLMESYQVKSVPCLLVTFNGEAYEKVYAFHSVPYMYEKISNYVKK